MNFKKISYENDMEILASPANLVTFSGTVLASNVTSGDENGRKYVNAGTLIDADGLVVEANGDALTGVPMGVLYKTIDVTDGDQPGALIVEGYLRADRVLDELSETAKVAVKNELLKITFR